MKEYDYKCSLEVRDYEIDMQKVVHHSVYIHYLEYCRNNLGREKGINIHEYHDKGYDIMVASLEQNYKASLRPDDRFYVTASMRLEGRLKMIFDQEIRREPDDKLILSARVVVVCVDIQRGRACMPECLRSKILSGD